MRSHRSEKVMLLAVAAMAPLLFTRMSSTATPERSNSASFGVFVGTSPCDPALKSMLEIPDSTAAEVVKWRLALDYDPRKKAPTTFQLTYGYGVPEQGSIALAATSAKGRREGTWRVVQGAARAPDALVCQLDAEGGRSLSFRMIGSHLLHLLDRDGRAWIGNAGWSHTLNRTSVMEEGPLPRVATDSLARSGFGEAGTRPMRAAESTYVGRSPGFDGQHPKLKWEVRLQRDAETLKPTTFRIRGTLYRAADLEGTWKIGRGAGLDPDAEVYELASHDGRTNLLLLNLDDDVLLFLGRDRDFLVGNSDFSFTLNQAEVRAPR